MANYREQIVTTANRYGVPPEIALAVATKESSIRQYGSDGGVLRGAAGEYGIFQLMPSTARDMGVNPEDPQENIEGGVRYLKTVYGWVGTGRWEDALEAYNGGIGNWRRGTVSSAAQSYSRDVMDRSGYQGGGAGSEPGQVLAYQGLDPWGWLPPGAADPVYDTGAVFSTTVDESQGPNVALLLLLGLAAALVIQQAV